MALRDRAPADHSTTSASRSTPTAIRPASPTRSGSGSPLARALVSEPDLLLLDEPASGLSFGGMASSATWCEALARACRCLLVEHHMDLVMRVCDEITVLDFGSGQSDGSGANSPPGKSKPVLLT